MLNSFSATLHPATGPHRFGALGFTLVEMMVVVTIIAIATMLGIPSYRAWVQNTQIYNAAESAQNGLQKAKSLAVSMNSNIEFVLVATNPPSWLIQLPANALACPLASGTALTTLLECSATEGAKNVSATTLPSSANTLTFNSLGGVVTSQHECQCQWFYCATDADQFYVREFDGQRSPSVAGQHRRGRQ